MYRVRRECRIGKIYVCTRSFGRGGMIRREYQARATPVEAHGYVSGSRSRDQLTLTFALSRLTTQLLLDPSLRLSISHSFFLPRFLSPSITTYHFERKIGIAIHQYVYILE